MKCAYTVNFDSRDYERCVIIEIRTPKARIEHICNECERVIKIKEEYRREILTHNSVLFHHKYCEDCLSVREVFFSSGWVYGSLWDQFSNFIRESDGNISNAYLKMVTKQARDKILDKIEEYWNEKNN